VRAGRVDGGRYSLAFRETVKDHPHVRTLVLDRGNHAGMVYLSDPHWFGLAALSHLKHWQARDVEHVTAAVPPLDVLAEGSVPTRRSRIASSSATTARRRSGPWTPTSTCRTGPGSPTATSGPRGSAAAPGTGTA
jgi:hypothetical protein